MCVCSTAEGAVGTPGANQKYTLCAGKSSVTFSGLAFDVAKNALQKAVHRGQTETAMELAADIILFRVLGGKANAALSNLDNRLMVMAFEDVSYGRYACALVVAKCLRTWRTTGHDETADKDVLEAIKCLCATPKSRAVSHIHAATVSVLKVDDDEKLVLAAKERIAEVSELSNPESTAQEIIELLKVKNDRAFYLADQLYNALDPNQPQKSESGRKAKPLVLQLDEKIEFVTFADGRKQTTTKSGKKLVTDAIYEVWKLLGDEIDLMADVSKRRVMKNCWKIALNEFHIKLRKERSIFLRYVMLQFRDHDKIDWSASIGKNEMAAHAVTQEECTAIFDALRAGKTIKVADEGTAAGGKIKKGSEKSVSTESCAENIDKEFINEEYAKVYEAVKKWEDKNESRKYSRKSKRKQSSEDEDADADADADQPKKKKSKANHMKKAQPSKKKNKNKKEDEEEEEEAEEEKEKEKPKKKPKAATKSKSKDKKPSAETLKKLAEYCKCTLSEKVLTYIYESCPRAQKAATGKQRVCYHGDTFYKLLYDVKVSGTAERLLQFMQYSEMFPKLGETVPHNVTLVQMEEDETMYAIAMKNLATEAPSKWTSLSGDDNVMDRQSTGFVRVVDIDDKYWQYLKFSVPIVKSLAIRSILGIGDTGRHNLGMRLKDKYVPIQLDYEEKQTMDSNGLVKMDAGQHPLSCFLSSSGIRNNADLLHFYKMAVTSPLFQTVWDKTLAAAAEHSIVLHKGRLEQFEKIRKATAKELEE